MATALSPAVLDRVDVALFPPFPYLLTVSRELQHHGTTIRAGAQDVFFEPDGGSFDIANVIGHQTSPVTSYDNVNERFLVVIDVTEENDWPSRVLVTDLLPAGFEIDNPKLVKSADLAAFEWLPETADVAHTEFRDDRFVAALNRTGNDERDFTLAYVVRAVSPGRYAHPAAQVEDMYRPHLEARTAAGTIEITGPRP